MYAAVWGNLEIVKLLVESGADVNAKCDSGETALYNAVINDHHQIADYLKPLTDLEIRAEIERYTETGKRWSASVKRDRTK